MAVQRSCSLIYTLSLLAEGLVSTLQELTKWNTLEMKNLQLLIWPVTISRFSHYHLKQTDKPNWKVIMLLVQIPINSKCNNFCKSEYITGIFSCRTLERKRSYSSRRELAWHIIYPFFTTITYLKILCHELAVPSTCYMNITVIYL